MKRAAFHNLGCKVNAYETDVMKELLFKNGYTEVPFEEEADVYIINTCTVTNIADRKSRQMIRRAKNLNPEAVVVAVGCYTQVNSEKGMPEGADIVIGNDMKGKVADILSGKLGLEKKYVKDLSRLEEYEDNKRSYKGIYKSAGWLQPVLFLLPDPVCQRACQEQTSGGGM